MPDVRADPALAHALLTPAQMAMADQACIAAGTPGISLMRAAGQAVARAIIDRWQPLPVLILCGPGNNGGDGFVLARLLQEAGWPVRLALWGRLEDLAGDALLAAREWQGPVEPAAGVSFQGAGLLVDALLGAGLSRAPAGSLLQLVESINASGLPVCAIDVPTGLDGAGGTCPGAAVQARLTVTFFRRKPGHLLLPGRSLCGELVCADIGIDERVLPPLRPWAMANHPDLWLADFPWPRLAGHKYSRGHALVIGGPMPGAGRMAALAAARIGAGLVSLAVPADIWPIQAAALSSVMVEALPAGAGLAGVLADPRRNAVLIGPGLGREDAARDMVLSLLASRRPCVLDADAISMFAHDPHIFLQALHPACVLTPHEGEFARIFDCRGDKLQRAGNAARQAGVIMVLKGADTIVAAADGRLVINDNAPPSLATAGTGDVLAGCILGLLAAGMPAFQAACAAVWLHGMAARQLGLGLLAEDLPAALPLALQSLAGMAPDRPDIMPGRL